jgi:tellurite resistance protein
MGAEDARSLATAWYYKEHFGFTKAPPLSDPEVVRNMALALVSVAGADGNLSEPEQAWILGYLAVKGYPHEVLVEASREGAQPLEKIRELMQLGILAQSGRILIYDAIRVASADGYSPDERKAVREVAAQLGLNEQDVRALEDLVQEELALKKKRIATLMPAGHPNL